MREIEEEFFDEAVSVRGFHRIELRELVGLGEDELLEYQLILHLIILSELIYLKRADLDEFIE